MSLILTGGAATRKELRGAGPRIAPNGGVEIHIELALPAGAAVAARGALVWLFDRGDAGFDLTSRTRFAYQVFPRMALMGPHQWGVRWVIVDRRGDHYISDESCQLMPQQDKEAAQMSGDLTATRWARADFSRRDLYQANPDFAGPQPELSGLRGAGIYAAVAASDLQADRACSVWVNQRLFVAGDEAAVAALSPGGGAAQRASGPPKPTPATAAATASPAAGGGGKVTPVAAAVRAKPAAVGTVGQVRAAGPSGVRARQRNLTVVVTGYVLVVAGSLMLGFVGWSVWCRLRWAK